MAKKVIALDAGHCINGHSREGGDLLSIDPCRDDESVIVMTDRDMVQEQLAHNDCSGRGWTIHGAKDISL